ncbi:MAG TPA: hypothetical protein VIV11_26130 [Kofleriaceae bacterium]
MACCLLLVLVLGGCSLVTMRAEHPAACTTSKVPSALDSIGGLTAGVVALAYLTPALISTVTPAPEDDGIFAKNRRGAYLLRGGAAIAIEAGFVTSAVIGVRRAKRCTKARAPAAAS